MAALDQDRLVRVLGMLGSEHMGERAAAAAKADELVRAAGITWSDIVVPASLEPLQGRVWREQTRELLAAGRCRLAKWCALPWGAEAAPHRRRHAARVTDQPTALPK
jgi:hypothetical protein